MLALFIEDLEKPIELDHFSSIAKEKCHFPLAFIPPTEEEQVRYSTCRCRVDPNKWRGQCNDHVNDLD